MVTAIGKRHCSIRIIDFADTADTHASNAARGA
jgi:hypothetical protein